MTSAAFKRKIRTFYKKNRRDLPWRPPHLKIRKNGSLDPYAILISEIMLQQTQVPRVIPKYASFLKRFPSFAALAEAPLSAVLAEWKGLGYNRRALNLKRAAEIIVKKHHGKLPAGYGELIALPGIGPNTAGSLLAFAYNIPRPFIETNIRSVYIHFFFQDKKNIRDIDLLALIATTLDMKNSREWYYALMDYGAYLKRIGENPSRRSAHHALQSPFKGSHREARSKILAAVLENPRSSIARIARQSGVPKDKAAEIATELLAEGMLRKQGGAYSID